MHAAISLVNFGFNWAVLVHTAPAVDNPLLHAYHHCALSWSHRDGTDRTRCECSAQWHSVPSSAEMV